MYNNICITIIVHIILLILGEIWKQLYKFTFVDVFAEVAEVNAEALVNKILPALANKILVNKILPRLW